MPLSIAPERRKGAPAGVRALIAAAALLAAGAISATPAVAEAAPKQTERIVALTPFSANVLAELGVRPVAVGQTPGDPSKLPRKLRNVPELALSHASNGPNLEQLAALDPDLLFSERTWRAGHDAIRGLGIRVVERDPYRVGTVRKKIKRIGALVKRRKRARKLAKRTAKQIRRASAEIESRPRVLIILGVGQTPYAFLPNSWGGDLVSRAGGELITDGLESEGSELLVSGGFAQLSNEEILVRNPDVIIAVPHGRGDDIPEIADELRENPYFAATNAGQNDRVYVSSDNTLLQAGTDVARMIRKVRMEFLQNR